MIDVNKRLFFVTDSINNVNIYVVLVLIVCSEFPISGCCTRIESCDFIVLIGDP